MDEVLSTYPLTSDSKDPPRAAPKLFFTLSFTIPQHYSFSFGSGSLLCSGFLHESFLWSGTFFTLSVNDTPAPIPDTHSNPRRSNLPHLSVTTVLCTGALLLCHPLHTSAVHTVALIHLSRGMCFYLSNFVTVEIIHVCFSVGFVSPGPVFALYLVASQSSPPGPLLGLQEVF